MTLEHANEREWRRRFLSTAGLILLCVVPPAGIILPLLQGDPSGMWRAAPAAFVALATLALARSGREVAATYMYAYGLSFTVMAVYALLDIAVALVVIPAMLTMVAFLQSRRAAVTLGAIVGGLMVVVSALRIRMGVVPPGEALRDVVLFCLATTIFLVIMTHLAQRSFAAQRAEARRLRQIERVVSQAARVAKGDLSVRIEGQGELAKAFREMVDDLRSLTGRVVSAALEVKAGSEQILTTAMQQAGGAAEQSSAAAETRAVVAAFLRSSREIAQVSNTVADHAVQTLETNNKVAESIKALATHTERISEILDLIKRMADKSELLALNAALEGTRAGEAGRGFALVAAQMQQLAEEVGASIAEIKGLTADIDEATASSVRATGEGTSLATKMARSATQIRAIANEQQGGTDQVDQAMSEMAQEATNLAAGSSEVVAASRALRAIADDLHALARGFRIETDSRPPPRPGEREDS